MANRQKQDSTVTRDKKRIEAERAKAQTAINAGPETFADLLATIACGIDPDAPAPSPANLRDAGFWRVATADTLTQYGQCRAAIHGLMKGERLQGEFLSHVDPIETEGVSAAHVFPYAVLRDEYADIFGRLAQIGLYPDLEADAKAWQNAQPGQRGNHPLIPIIKAWQEWTITRPKPIRERTVLVKEYKGTILAPTPGAIALTGNTELIVYEGGDGLELTPEPETPKRYKFRPPDQNELFSGPRRLNEAATSGMILTSAAQIRTDGRKTLRGDVIALAKLCYALAGPAIATENEAAIWLGGKDTDNNKERFWNALNALDSLKLYPYYPSSFFLRFATIETLERETKQAIFGPPRWWLHREKYAAYKLTGSLFRRKELLADGQPGRGTSSAHWGAVPRTLDGLEGALAWGGSLGGRRKDSRLPLNLKPERPGGPGPEVFVDWRRVLQLSGEHVEPDAPTRGADGERYRDRVRLLEKAGYFISGSGPNATAPAGDTVEIVKKQDGRSGEGGIVIRASARYCEAYAKLYKNKQAETRIPAAHLLPHIAK